jgi:peptidoglycan-associated lipoprotein
MSMGVKRLSMIALVVVALPFATTGCQKKAAYPTCKNDTDCRVDATGAEINGVCYMGKCEECVQSADCTDLKQCVDNKCVGEGLGSASDGSGSGVFGDCSSVERIHFDFDQYSIKDEYKRNVDSLAQCLESNPDKTVLIEGYTDDRGTPAYNMALGQRRADVVRNYLKNTKGIASKRVKTQSYGEQKPLSTESTEYGWQQNRRAEFVIGR